MDLEKTIKDTVYKIAVDALISEAIASASWLALPIINPVFVFIVRKVADKLYNHLALLVNFEIIDLQTKAQANAYKEAVDKLKESPNDQAAKDEFRKRLADLVRMRPSTDR